MMKTAEKLFYAIICIFAAFTFPDLCAGETAESAAGTFLTQDTEFIFHLDFRKIMETSAAKKMLAVLKEKNPGEAKDLQDLSEKIPWVVIAGKGDHSVYIMETGYTKEALLQILKRNVPDLSMQKVGRYQVYTGKLTQNLYTPEILFLTWISPSCIAFYSGRERRKKFFMDCLASHAKGIPSDLKPILKKSNAHVLAGGGISMKSVYRDISNVIPVAQNIRGARFELQQTPASEILLKSEIVTSDSNTAAMLVMILQQYKILFSGLLQDESMMKMTPQKRAEKLDRMVRINANGNSVKVLIQLPQDTVYSLAKEIFSGLGIGNLSVPRNAAGSRTIRQKQ